jgi:hypothetical protein
MDLAGPDREVDPAQDLLPFFRGDVKVSDLQEGRGHF